MKQTRREWFATAGCGAAMAAGVQMPARPNILLLLSDDHSYPFVGAYGDSNVRTPTLDTLAADGMRCHRFFTVAPQCVPSRAGLMTGRSAVAVRNTRFSSPLPRDEVIFPELLRGEAGYYTGVAGRGYHLDGPGGAQAHVMSIIDRLGLQTFKERLDYVDTSQPPDYAARVNAFFDRKPANKPFFLWMNFADPHAGWDAQTDEPDPATLKVPGYLPDTPSMRRQLAAYCGEVNRLDRQVKEILDILERRGFAKKTLVVFAGDNGLAFPHGKGSLHDPGLNVPFLVRWPGVVKPDSESRALISAEDLGPTLLAAAGVAAPARMSGVSFLGLLRGQPFTPRQYLFAERGPHGSTPVSAGVKSSTFDLSRCVRSERYKLIYNCTPWVPYQPVDSAALPAWQDMIAANANGTLASQFREAYFTTPRPVYELYDLERDPSELTNLAGDPKLASVEHELRMALAEKMVRDFDYLPLPLSSADAAGPRQTGAPVRGQRQEARGL